jgi:hypothetical protein
LEQNVLNLSKVLILTEASSLECNVKPDLSYFIVLQQYILAFMQS